MLIGVGFIVAERLGVVVKRSVKIAQFFASNADLAMKGGAFQRQVGRRRDL